MIFAHPYMLWLLGIALLMGVVSYVGMRRSRRPRALGVAVSRFLCLAAAALALARPLARWPGPGPATVVIADLSPSIADQDAARIAEDIRAIQRTLKPGGELRIIAAGSRIELLDNAEELKPEAVAPLRQRLAAPVSASDPADGGTALADALRLADAVIGTSRSGRIVLITDGLETRGDALGQVKRLSDRGIPVRTVRREPQSRSLCFIEDVRAPAAAATGQTIELSAMIRSSEAQQARLEVRSDGALIAESAPLTIQRGQQQTQLLIPLPKPGINRFELSLRVEGAPDPADAAVCVVWAAPPARVLVVCDPGTRDRTAAALSSLLGASASIATVAASDIESALLEDVDLLVLSNLPADQVPAPAHAKIRDAVASGLGLLVTGGPASFGPGGWADSPVAQILPVRMPQELERQDPSATAVFVIDTSGSMTGPRVGIAKEVVRLALRRLQPQDKAGIVEFYGSKRWAAPIQSAANHLDLNRALNRLTAGGGTVILPAIEEAEFALKNVNTRTRHVIILTDGGVESGPFEMLSRRMADAGVTVSTVLVGPGQHSPFLASIAQWGRGRFYHAPDRFNLPEIILHQPQTSSPPPTVQTPTPLIAAREDDDVTRGIDFTQAPPLGGYVRTQAKPTADVLLRTSGGDALLARWRFGSGRVATLATDLGSAWVTGFAQWPKASMLTSNLLRTLYAAPPQGLLQVQPIRRPAGVEVQIQAVEASETNGSASVELELLAVSSGEPIRRLVCDPIKPGTWNTLLRDVPPGEYQITARLGDVGLAGHAGLVVAEGREHRLDQADADLLDRIDELGSAAEATASTKGPGNTAVTYAETWPALVLVSLGSFLLNVFIRRRPLPAAEPISKARLPMAASLVLAMLLSAALASPARAQAAATQPATRSAAEAIEAGALDAAAVELDRQATTRPADAMLLSRLAAVHEIRGDDASAIDVLKRAIGVETDSDSRARLTARLVAMLLDSDEREQASALLKSTAASGSTAEQRRAAAIVAATYGQHEIVNTLTHGAEQRDDAFELLLRGTSLLRMDLPEQANECFAQALPLATQARDRRYVIERLIASARQSGKLQTLADAWMNDAALPADRLFPLVGVLRELGRADDILRLWRRSSSDVAMRDAITSPRFMSELVAAMREARRLGDAEAACREMLRADPNNDRWLSALCRILVEQDREADADAAIRATAESADSAARIMRVAELAKSLGRDDVAIEIAAKAQRFGTSAHAAALLFQAELEAHRGQRAESIRTLNRAVELAGSDQKLTVAVAEAVEQSGDAPRAIELYRKAAAGGEDVLQRLAWLLEQNGKPREAEQIWQKLWRSAGSPARRREAQNRLLDLASRNGTIADLAGELEDRLAARTASGDDLALLIDIYVGARDPASASEILNEYKSLAGGEAQALDQLAKLYLKCGRFGQADRVLRQLLIADPEHAIDTLQEIAVLAIERGRPVDAQKALEEIAQRTGSASSTAELRAGVYEQLGMPAEAAREYRAAVEANPDQVEDWVLWAGAMNAAGQKDRAVSRLLVLAFETDNDDVFTVAVDGLLNLEAARPALRVARRYAISRVAQNGRKLIHYQLIRDLSESIGDMPMALRAGELSLLVAGEQRTELIRELITICKSAGQAQRAVELGRTLLALGDQVPPQVFLDIGRQLLQEGRFVEADGAFARAEEVSGDDEIRAQVAKLYEGAGQMRLALGTLGPLLRLHPNDIELRCRAAGMHEQLGEHTDAFEQYLKALDLMLRRGTAGGAVAATAPAEGGRTARAVPRQGASMTEADQFLDGLVQGLVVCARTDQSRARLLEMVSAAAKQDLQSAEPSAKVPSSCAQKAAVLRRFAFALHAPDVADAFDLAVCQRYPQDRSFAATALGARVEWGLLERAGKVAAATSQPAPAELDLRNTLFAGSSDAPGTIAQQTDPDSAAILLPQLILHSQLDRAQQVLRGLERRAPRKQTTIPTLLAAALAVNDPASAELWAGTWLTRAETRKAGRPDATDAADCIATAWPALSEPARRNLLARVVRMLEQAAEDDRPALALLGLRMAVILGESDELRARLGREAAAQALSSGATVAEIVQSVPLSAAPDVLTKAVEAAAASKRRTVLLQMLGASEVPLPESLLNRFMELMAAAPTGTGATRREQLVAGNWARNTAQAAALRQVATLLAKEPESDPATGLVIAQALATAGDQPAADEMAAHVINVLTSAGTRTKLDTRTLSDAVAVLSASGAEAMLNAEFEAALSDLNPSRSVTPVLKRAMLLEHLGQEQAAAQAFAEAFQLAPSDMDVRRLVTDRFDTQLRWADLLDAFAPFMNDDTVVNQPQRYRIQRAYRELGRFDEAGDLMLREEGPLKHLQRLQTAAQAGRMDELLPLFRTFHVDNRWERRSFTPYLVASGGAKGLSEFTGRSTEGITSRRSIYRIAADLSWAPEELSALLDAATPLASETSTLAAALAAASGDERVLARIVATLRQALSAEALTAQDRTLMIALLREGHSLPADLLAELDRSMTSIEPGDRAELLKWAMAWQATGQADRVSAVRRWYLCADIVLSRSSAARTRTTPAQADADALKPLSLAERRMVEAAAPSPTGSIDDEGESERLARLAELDPAAAERTIDQYLQRALICTSSHQRLAMLWARLAAQRGDLAEYRARVARALDVAQSRGLALRVPDIRLLLPPAGSPEQLGALVGVVEEALRDRAVGRPQEADIACRQICLLGDWAFDRNLRPSAETCLNEAAKLTSQTGEHQLWIADLARRVERHEMADEIELSLLKQRRLPIARIEPLLQRVQATSGEEAARTLSADVALYCGPKITGPATRPATQPAM